MDSSKILSSSILDLVFDGRNKEYGAYELRNTYPKRITTAIFITAGISLLLIAGTVLAKSSRPQKPDITTKVVILTDVNPVKADLPKPEIKPEPVQVRTKAFTQIEILDDKDVQHPPATQEDIINTKIDIVNHDGVDDIGPVGENIITDSKGVIDAKKNDEPKGPFEKVEIDAKFSGNWEKFLLKNLDANIPADNGAPAGHHTIIVQFVVDVDGSVSDIKPLTNLGYGMEQEAVRVLKKATKWEPAIQNGRTVKAFRRQPITFVVSEE